MTSDAEKEKKYDNTLLYVEDDEVIREALKKILSRKFNKIFTAENGKEGLDLFNANKIEIVITDIQMPVMNGLEMLRRIKSINKKIPIIITTAFDDTKYFIEAIDIGVNSFVQKPVNVTNFWQAVENSIRLINLEEELKKQNKLLNEYKSAIDASSIVSKTDVHGIINYVNDQFCYTTGYSKEELIGRTHNLIRHPDTPQSVYKDMWKKILSKKIWKGILQIKAKNGEEFFFDSCIVPILDSNGDIAEFISIRYEITELIRKERILAELYTDKLTGLPNREKLFIDITETPNACLFLINVDSFKEINDFYGSGIGDAVLVEFSRRLKNKMASIPNKIYRLQSDEFAVLFDWTFIETDVEIIAGRLREQVCDSLFIYSEAEIHVSFTIGIALSLMDNIFLQDKLILWADMALKTAKKMQRPILVYHDSLEISKEYENNIIWTRKVRHALKDDRIVPFYQPIVNNHTKKVEKYETLVRLLDTDGNCIPPSYFLNIAQRSGFYNQITRIIIRKAFDFFADNNFEFSVNLSAKDFLDKDTSNFLFDVLKENPGVSSRVVFEILESEGIENYNDVKMFIEKVKSFGCKIAIDDFGSGYSNFTHIMKLDVDYLKIDASIISQIDSDRTSQIVARNIVNVASELGVKTIAEYVTSMNIYSKILEIGIDYSQGYFFGEPSDHLL